MDLTSKAVIRATLWGLYYRRKATLNKLRLPNRTNNLRAQADALASIKMQLIASEQWSEESHRKMVVGMKDLITLILPVQFDKSHVKYCIKVLEMIAQCRDLHSQTSLF